MAFGTKVQFDAVRELAFGSISGSYSAIGTALTDHARIATFNNSTNVDVYISLDGSTNHIRLASGGFAIFDFTANEVMQDGMFINVGTIFYCKAQSSLPSSGTVWIEVVAAAGGV